MYEHDSGYADSFSVTQTYSKATKELGASIEIGAYVDGIEVSGGQTMVAEREILRWWLQWSLSPQALGSNKSWLVWE